MLWLPTGMYTRDVLMTTASEVGLHAVHPHQHALRGCSSASLMKVNCWKPAYSTIRWHVITLKKENKRQLLYLQHESQRSL